MTWLVPSFCGVVCAHTVAAVNINDPPVNTTAIILFTRFLLEARAPCPGREDRYAKSIVYDCVKPTARIDRPPVKNRHDPVGKADTPRLQNTEQTRLPRDTVNSAKDC